jgi:hypothetical protein
MPTEITFAILALIILAACAFLLRQQRRHYESLLRDVRADNHDLRGRMYVSKGQPPPGVDLQVEHEEKKAERQKRQSDPTLKSPPDPTWGMRKKLAANENRRLGRVK